MKSFLQNNDMEMYSKHNEGKFVVAERFIRTLKNKIYKYMASVSKNVYINKLDDIVRTFYKKELQKTMKKSLELKSHQEKRW